MRPPGAAAPAYPTYSQAVKAGNTIYVAGTTGAELSDAVVVHTLLMRPEDASGLIEVYVGPGRTSSSAAVPEPGR